MPVRIACSAGRHGDAVSILPLGNLRRRRAPVLTPLGRVLLAVLVTVLLGVAVLWVVAARA
jgi:hypothetical protein